MTKEKYVNNIFLCLSFFLDRNDPILFSIQTISIDLYNDHE